MRLPVVLLPLLLLQVTSKPRGVGEIFPGVIYIQDALA